MKKTLSVFLVLGLLLMLVPLNTIAQANSDLQNAPGAYGGELPEAPVEEIIELFSLDKPDSSYGSGGGAASLKDYEVGATKEILSPYSSGYANLECLHIGFFCTVWGQSNCDDRIRLNTEIAKNIAEEFDSRYDTFVKYFGRENLDVDKDGKIAILCYDIGDEYAKNTVLSGGSTKGYFWSEDFRSSNRIDCIHIDTYPFMGGKTNLLGNVDGIYSTLFHEYQHFVNYSTRANKLYTAKDKFIDEAMSMAAEHLLFGYETVSFRVNEFNTNVAKNESLFLYWDDALDVANYGYAYIWGQYLRTRYAQLMGEPPADDEGAGVYAQIMGRLDSPKKSILEVTADIIYGNDPQYASSEQRIEALANDFKNACSIKADTGKYGFNNEEFAEAIHIENVSINSVNTDPRIILTIGKNEARLFGKTVENDAAPKIVNGRTMVPIRFVAEAIGATVGWDEVQRRTMIIKDNLKIAIAAGSANAEVNGETVTLDCEPFVENGRTYLPLRFVSETLGAKVEWKADEQQVIITK